MGTFDTQINAVLKQTWGYDSLRPLQKEIIENCLLGHDQLAVLPTGAGKSICFQVPGLILEGICLVISPLIALMKDQVQQLKKRNINAEAIFSGMHPAQLDRILDNCAYGEVKFLYLSPERLKSELFLERAKRMKVSLIAIDEAHCIAEWGHDFRPSYLEIKHFLQHYKSIPKIALTASATQLVQNEIVSQLELANAKTIKGSLLRPNLSYQIVKTEQKEWPLLSKLYNTAGSKIIYVNTRQRAEVLAKWLIEQGYNANFYHAGLETSLRNQIQNDWISDKFEIIVATNAFGMGIDKPNVRVVFHYDLPQSLEAYYQEAGRAGRDGNYAEAIFLNHPFDGDNLLKKISEEYILQEEIRRVYQAMANYFQIAAGAAQGESYALDIKKLVFQSRIDQKTVQKGLKKLQQLGFVEVSENGQTLSQIKLELSQTELYNFILKYPKYEFFTKAILRIYGGNLMHEFHSLNEIKLADFLKIPAHEVTQWLNELTQLGVILYEKATNLPKITYLTPRLAAEDLKLDEKAIRKILDIKKQKANEIIGFIKAQNCRTCFIQDYFGDATQSDCGICDNCQEEHASERYELLKSKIITLLKNGPIAINELKSTIFDENLGKAIQALQQQEKVTVENNDLLKLT